MNAAEVDKKTVWRNLAIVTVLLVLLIGPNFGPVPGLLGGRLSIEASVVALLASFWIGFCVILAVILRMSGGMSLRDLLRSLGLGAPTRTAAAVVGLLLGLLWGVLFLTSIFQFDPDADIARIDGFRILTAVIAATGALLEDFVTRGFLMNQLQKIRIPGWVQVLGSGLVFALYHTIWGFNIFSFLFSLVYGVMLGGLFLWGKRSLTPVILGHSLAVLISEPFASMLIFLAAKM
ncbi:MAG: CPBP family intramembrane metalloprotease [Anaerolineales bacterium]|nr:CPBP family intramembrane metalloprotease [Anaerolineales bacterium]